METANQAIVPFHGAGVRTRSQKQLSDVRSKSKLFQRQMKAVTLDPEKQSEETRQFIKKYHQGSNRIKLQLRNLWQVASMDMHQAGLVVKARATAFKTESNDAEWMSLEQLIDAFKSGEHAESYAKFCTEAGLVGKDPKRGCPVFLYEKKIVHTGTRREGSLEKQIDCNACTSDEEDSDSDLASSDSSDSSSKDNHKEDKTQN